MRVLIASLTVACAVAFTVAPTGRRIMTSKLSMVSSPEVLNHLIDSVNNLHPVVAHHAISVDGMDWNGLQNSFLTAADEAAQTVSPYSKVDKTGNTFYS